MAGANQVWGALSGRSGSSYQGPQHPPLAISDGTGTLVNPSGPNMHLATTGPGSAPKIPNATAEPGPTVRSHPRSNNQGGINLMGKVADPKRPDEEPDEDDEDDIEESDEEQAERENEIGSVSTGATGGGQPGTAAPADPHGPGQGGGGADEQDAGEGTVTGGGGEAGGVSGN